VVSAIAVEWVLAVPWAEGLSGDFMAVAVLEAAGSLEVAAEDSQGEAEDLQEEGAEATDNADSPNDVVWN
jgi:hypothetical protein